ncbi:MAG: LamG domain-containing protein [Phycisphaerales bacterium]
MTKYDYLGLLTDQNAEHYWALNEAIESMEATDGLGSYAGNYSLLTTSGTGTNDEGGVVPIFVDASDSVSIPWGNDFKTSEGTITAWVKSTNSNNLESMSVLGMLYESGGYASINLTLWNSKLYGYISDDGTWNLGKAVSSSSKIILPDTWYHVAISWGSNGLTIYVDGTQVGNNSSNTDGLATAKKNQGGEQPLLIGAGYTIVSSKHVVKGFKGSVAHTVFFPNQLKSSIIADMAAIRPDKINMALVDDSWEQIFK